MCQAILLAVSTKTLVLSGGLILTAGIVATLLLRRRRADVWREFSRTYGLRVGVNALGPRVGGKVDGHDVVLEVVDESSDTGPLGIEEVRMQIQFVPPDWPQGLRIESAQGLLGDVQQAIEPDRITTDNEAFDREFLIVGEDAAAARDWLTESRQLELLNLVAGHRDKLTILDDSGLALRTRSAISRLQTLSDMLTSLLKVVDSLGQAVETTNISREPN